MQTTAVTTSSRPVSVRRRVLNWVKVIFAFLLFLLFMVPFILVVMNSAKTAQEIS